jgi:hypothetical protein
MCYSIGEAVKLPLLDGNSIRIWLLAIMFEDSFGINSLIAGKYQGQ